MDGSGGNRPEETPIESTWTTLSRRRVLQSAVAAGVGSAIWVNSIESGRASTAGNYIYSGNMGAEVHKTSPDGQTEWVYTGHSDPVRGVAVDADGYVYTASGDTEVHKISPDGERVWAYTGHSNNVRRVAVGAKSYVYTAGGDNDVHKVSPEGDTEWVYSGHSDSVRSVTVDAEGYVYSGSRDEEVHKISPEGSPVWQYSGHTAEVWDISVDEMGYVYSGGQGEVVHKISPDGDFIWQYTGHDGRIWGVAVDADGFVYTASPTDNEVHKISPDGEPLWQYTGHDDNVYEVAVDADGYVYSGSRDEELHRIAPDGDRTLRYTGHSNNVRSPAVDDQYTAAFGFDGYIDLASFAVEITNTNAPVEGDTLEVTAEVTNTGDVGETQTISLAIDGQVVDSVEHTVDGGETETVTLDWDTAEGDAGEYRAVVESEDDTDETDVAVQEPADIAVSITDTTEPTVEGDTLEVTADVENMGGASDTQTLVLGIDGQVVDSVEHTVDGGKTETVTLDWDTAEGDSGKYQAVVESEDDTDEISVTVHDTAGFLVAIADTNAPVTQGDTLEVTADVENTGRAGATQAVTLEVNGLEVDSQTLSLDSGESSQRTFQWQATDRNGVGVRIASADDTDNAHVGLTPDSDGTGETTIEILSTNAPVSEGDSLDVDVELSSTADAEHTQDVHFEVDGQHEETREVTVGPGETTVERFSWAVDSRTSVGLRVAGPDDWDNTFILLSEADFTLSGL